MRNPDVSSIAKREQRASVVSASAVDERASGLQTLNRDPYASAGSGAASLRMGNERIRRKSPDGRRLGELGGKVYIIVELFIELRSKQTPTDDESPG